MFVHAFGAYFGLAVSFVNNNRKVNDSKNEGTVVHSDLFSMIGEFIDFRLESLLDS